MVYCTVIWHRGFAHNEWFENICVYLLYLLIQYNAELNKQVLVSKEQTKQKNELNKQVLPSLKRTNKTEKIASIDDAVGHSG